ncbi:MAG: DUF2092 domain-containing protein [Gammaproteobacteria bacterium]|nr:DUF2092 domain-containing protein [Gammaproteobacteria bacterium]
MRTTQVCLLLFVSLLVPLGAHAQDAESILAKARELQLARWDGVDNYSIEQTVAGSTVTMDYVRVDETSFRLAPRSGVAGMSAKSDDGSIVNFDEMQEIARTAQYLGTESIGGRPGYHLKADDVDYVQESDGQSISFDTFEVWLDTSEYVPLKMVIHGTASSAEGTREIVMEKVDTDYRKVPGSNLYEAYHQVMTMSGVLDPEQQKQLQEAQVQMAEFEKQLASMPEGQRQMMENMMRPKIEMMKKMASGGGMELIIEIQDIKVNSLAN